MKSTLYTLFFLLPAMGFAQFQIGETVVTFNDPDRTGGTGSGGGPGRQIETQVYYPAGQAGQDQDFIDGAFPTVVVGHGFVMTVDAYMNIVELLVPQGYVVALPVTEGSFSPSHADFGLDIAVVAESLQELNTDPESIFFQHISPQVAAAGHSMGGGAAVLASAEGAFDAYIGLASAETNPSAIEAAGEAQIPALIFSGSADGVTPPDAHQIPIYDAWAGNCKLWVNIEGGGHCFFANESATCDFGELFTSGEITLTRQEQQEAMNTYLLPWLNFWLKGEGAFDSIESNLAGDEGVSYQLACENPVGVSDESLPEVKAFPNPSSGEITLRGNWPMGARLTLFRPTGRMVGAQPLPSQQAKIDLGNGAAGLYFLLIEGDGYSKVIKVMRN